MAPRDQRQVRKERRSLEQLLDLLPVRNTGRFGRPGDPWNLLFLGSETNVVEALRGAGWLNIPRSVVHSTLRGILELVQGQPLASFPPMNSYSLFGNVQSHNWAQVVRPIVARHHFRLWKLPFIDDAGRPYWWGSGNYDLDCRYRDLSHVPDPDMDLERDYIAGTLKNSRYVESIEHVPSERIPRSGANDKGYPFRHDGRILVVGFAG